MEVHQSPSSVEETYCKLVREHVRSWSPRTSAASFANATSVLHIQHRLILGNRPIPAVAASQPDAAKRPGVCLVFFLCVYRACTK